MKKIITTLSFLLFISLHSQSQIIVNAGFEEWKEDTGILGTPILNPVGWFTGNFGLSSPDAVSQSTDYRGGKYSAKIAPISLFTAALPGILGVDIATTQKSKFLNGYVKSKISANDTFIIGISYLKSSTQETFESAQRATASKSNWTAFNFQIDLPSNFTPDSVSIYVFVMGSMSSYGMLDDLSFSNTSIGTAFGSVVTNAIRPNKRSLAINSSISPNPAKDVANLSFNMTNPSKVEIVIHDVTGKELRRINNNCLLYTSPSPRD